MLDGTTMTKGDTSRTIKTTETSLEVVGVVRRRQGATMAEIADELGLAKSTVHGHLTTLERHGYLTKKGESYHLGFELLLLGESIKDGDPAYRAAREQVDRLVERTNEEADFSIEQNGRIISIVSATPNAGEPTFTVGSHFRMTTTAPGKALLAEFPEQRVDEIVERWGLPAPTQHSITTRDALDEELERIRRRGYAVNDQECTEGLRTVSAVAKGPDGSPLGALTISGPTYRITGEAIESELADQLLGAVADLEESVQSQYGQPAAPDA